MKKFLLFLTSLSLTTLVSAEDKQQFDFAKINTHIQEALQELNENSDQITQLEYSLIPGQTDVSKNQYGIEYNLGLAEAPWGKQELNSQGVVVVSTKSGEAGAPERLAFKVDLTMKTDVLSMLKHHVKSHSRCEQEVQLAGIAKIVRDRHCEYVAKLDEIQDTKELYSFLGSKIEDHQADVKAYHAALSDFKGVETKQQAVVEIVDVELERTEAVADFLDNVELKETDAGFVLNTPAFKECPILASNGIQLGVSPTEATLVGEVDLRSGGTLLTAAQPVMSEILTDIQNNEAYTRKLVQLDMKLFLNTMVEAPAK